MWYEVEYAGFICSKKFASKQAAIDYADGLNALSGCKRHYSVYECVNIYRHKMED